MSAIPAGQLENDSEIETSGRPAEGTRRRRWPVHRQDVAWWLVAYLTLTAITVGVGFLIMHVWPTHRSGTLDAEVARWIADQRTPRRVELARVGSSLADSYTLVPAIALAIALFAVLFRRWNEVLLLVAAIMLERAVFMTSTLIVDRDRPPVGQLDGAPPTSSFPSGHVAAAVVFYLVLAIVISRHVGPRILRVLAWAVAIIVPVVVAISRMLLGMHHLTDVTAGATLGIVSVVTAGYLTHRALGDDQRRHTESATAARSPSTTWPLLPHRLTVARPAVDAAGEHTTSRPHI